MFKLNKTLIKKGFKSVFKTKLFSILMIFMILLSSATYTMLQSSSESLSKTYTHVMKEGNLADDIVKENFLVSPSAKLEIKIKDSNGNYINIDENNVKSNQQIVGTIGTLEIYAIGTQEYQRSNPVSTTISYDIVSNNSFQDEMEQIEKSADVFKSDFKAEVKSNLASQYVYNLNQAYKNKLTAKNIQSLSVNSGYKAFKMVNLGKVDNQDLNVNNLVMYDGTKLFTKEKTNLELHNELKKRMARNPKGSSGLSVNGSKGYTLNAIDTTGSIVDSVTDPSSYEAIVSPAYANANGKIAISQDTLANIVKSDETIMDTIASNSTVANRYKKNLIWIDKTPFFIVGIGTTPDFIYPIIDGKHPTIDVKNQAIVYVNNRGFERIHDAFRSNPQENYVSIKYDGKLSADQIKSLRSELETVLRGGNNINIAQGSAKTISLPQNSWPKNINILTKMTDQNDQILLAQERVSFLSDLKKTITTLSYATTTLLVVFTLSIIVMVFNVLLSINKKTFATMLALGYSKTQIAISNAISTILLVGIPSAIGYIIGHLSQFWFTGIFKDYWVIPNYGTSFSLLSLIVTAIVPLLTTGFLIILVTFVQLRYSIPDLINESAEPASGFLTKMIAKTKYIGVMTKYSLGLISRNLGKLALITITSVISITSISVGLGTIGKANNAYHSTVGMSNYNFEVDLYTPTIEGGQYKRLNKSSVAKMINQTYVKETYDSQGKPQFTVGDPHWHIPSTGDASYGLPGSAGTTANINNAMNYLKDMLQTKIFVDKKVAGLNPWDIASRLMPENQRNIADEDANKTLSISSGNTLNDKIKALSDRVKSSEDFPYIISYDNIIMDDGDEDYTYVDATSNNNESVNFHIKGVRENTQMINNIGDKLKAMNNSADKLPILIDKYIAKKYSLKRGSTIEYVIHNMGDRNTITNRNKETIVRAKVFDIVDGYNAEGIYTTQQKANQLLKLGSDGFNGVFSKSQNPTILNTISLYSASGIYAGTDSFYGQWDPVLNNMIKIWNHPEIANDVDEFKQVYSATPYVAATSLVNWKEINKLTFKNISHLASTIIYIIQMISIVLSVIFTLIIAALLLTSNKKKIATLWTLGYRKTEVAKVFLSMYIMPIIISAIIAIGISIGVLAAMQIFVMNLGQILIPFALSWWMPIIAVLIVSSVFIGATFIMIGAQSSDKALDAFKGD